jgi:dihydroflavonol-4-reductase
VKHAGSPLTPILILGAGGFVGLNTVRAFLAAGLVPRCGRRARGNVLGLRGLNAPLVVTDFTQPQSLRDAFHGVDVLVHAAAHYPRLSLDPQQTIARGLAELDAVLDAAAASGVRRLVFVSSTATVAPHESRASTEEDVFAACPDWGTYHALKWHLERRLHDEQRLEIVVACPAACLGPLDWKVGTSALLLATARGAPPAHPDGAITTVDARDVADALVMLATMSDPPKRLLLAHDRSDAHELLKMLSRRYGAPPPPPPLSPAAARSLADLQEEAAARNGGRPALSRELVDLIVHSPKIDAWRSRSYGLRYRPLSDTLDAWDSWAQRMGMIPRPPTELSA